MTMPCLYTPLRCLLLTLLLTGMAGCTSVYSFLTPEQKRDIYERVSEDVKNHVDRAEFLHKSGYLHQALNEYEQARFYGDPAPFDPEITEILKNRMQQESRQSYARGRQALAQKHYVEALQAFNAVMKADPDYADAEKYYWRMLNRSENIIRIDGLSDRLRAVLQSPAENSGNDREAERLANEILSYQYDHPLAYEQHMREFNACLQQRRQGMALVRQGYHAILSGDFSAAEKAFKEARSLQETAQEGVTGLYRLQKRKDAIYLTTLADNSLRRGDLLQAEQRARRAVDADKDYAPATVLLKKIMRQQLLSGSESGLAEARTALAQGRYLDALEMMNDILREDPEHSAARVVYDEATDRLTESVPAYIEQGTLLFNQSRYDEAARYFAGVLAVDPDNHIAGTYLKRIELRKQTLQMFNQASP